MADTADLISLVYEETSAAGTKLPAGRKLNCWEVKKCGRQPGGEKTAELGICPATLEKDFDGFFGGKNSGRACWLVAGTFCKGQIQGTFAQKFKNCAQCEFYNQVMREEGTLFDPADRVMKYIDKTHEQRVDERTKELREAKEAVEATKEKLEKAYKDLEDVNNRSIMDMDIAARIQTSYFPKKVPENKYWDVSFIFNPVTKVSGDFYDFYTKDGLFRGVSLFDISGHGIGPGLLTLLARSVISEGNILDDSQRLGGIVGRINRRLIKELEAGSNFLTGVVLRFTENKVEYVNAGHSDILIRRRNTGRAELVKPKEAVFHGPILGLTSMKNSFPTILFRMRKGDMLLLFTDCLIESQNRAGEEYGFDRLMKSFSALSPDKSAEEGSRRLLSDFYAFTPKEGIRDDLTVILIKRTGDDPEDT
jgi:sigma-B regulation protein RsbU (phosphoserine phosphatase)